MNTRAAETETAPRGTGRSAVPGGRSVLSADIRVSGDMSSSGTVEVLGEVLGDITAQSLIISGDGRVVGTIRAETVEVRGKLEGKAACVSFTLRATAQVMAEVNYENLIIESGAQIDGRFMRPKV